MEERSSRLPIEIVREGRVRALVGESVREWEKRVCRDVAIIADPEEEEADFGARGMVMDRWAGGVGLGDCCGWMI